MTSKRRLEAGPPWLVWQGDVPAQLDRLHDLELNFDPEGLPAVARDAWHVDAYRRSLRLEPPGEPVRHGPFETAKLLLCGYEFADPTRIRAYYWVDTPLEQRDMLLEIRYLGLRVRVGVRIGPVFDEVRETAGRSARVWGWAYRTLEGHLERGHAIADPGVDSKSMERNPIAIYLNDHLAGATVGVEVARRTLKSNSDNEFGEFLRRLTGEVEDDRQTLQSVMRELDIRVDRAKQAAAWGSEKLARLKPNGRLVGYSSLSRVVELEFLAIGITGKLGMWRALQHVLDAPLTSADLASLVERADRQRTEVEEYRLRAAAEAFRAGSSATVSSNP